MAIKSVLDSIEGVDDALKALYIEQDGKFVLDVEGIDDHPDVANLKSAYQRTKSDRETAKGEAAALKARIAELEKGAPDTAATQAKLTALQDQLAEAQAKAGEEQAKRLSITRDQALTTALTGAGVTNATFLKAAQRLLSDNVKVGDDGTPLVETDMGPKLLGDYVKMWVAGEGKAFVTPPTGGGSKGNDSGTAAAATMKRADFDNLSPADKLKAVTERKVTLVD
jgi:uncharacterized membrane protein YdfJ with MMPL/SSD domain